MYRYIERTDSFQLSQQKLVTLKKNKTTKKQFSFNFHSTSVFSKKIAF